MNAAQLLLLARAYADLTGLSLVRIGVKACKNDKIFVRLAAGMGASSRSVDKAAVWFAENWPENAEWPAEVPRPMASAA